MKKIGIFGGTFNPIHLGHARLAYNVYSNFKLDELVFIPTKLPPHKSEPNASAKDRYNMAIITAQALSQSGICNFTVSDFEIKSAGVSYTYLTLLEWRRRYPSDALYFITGSDIFITIESWQNFMELFELTNFIVANREVSFEKVLSTIPKELLGRVTNFRAYISASSKELMSGSIILYEMDPVKISSTVVRGQLANLIGINGIKASFTEGLLENVYKYILEKNLYEGGAMEGLKLLCRLIDDKLGEDIVSFNLRGISSITDYLVIATGKADTHVKAISEHLLTEMRNNGIPPLAYEGLTEGVWVCIDFGDIIVHIMREVEREYYNLEGIWGGAPKAE
ncbi:MAG: nicotinate-nucleotide adenylyltransferase [Deferribacteraceae bacterium]|jgi:nicotinate-nucleotide adenylyltransferase|nr:nicotinate-nucleotide adenylyltransferase [Deferribacteraceae bacterium]